MDRDLELEPTQAGVCCQDRQLVSDGSDLKAAMPVVSELRLVSAEVSVGELCTLCAASTPGAVFHR